MIKRAKQLPLGREVALKIVRADADTGRVAAQLLREARVTGLLEHPNVVPVHVLCRDDRGLPAIVMKRIAGVAWTDLIRDPHHPARAGDRGDARDFHLDVFLQVCSAVQFAHSRKIIHRDLKPDNVMIGEFGEVYVLDWGLAVATGDDPPAGVPHVREVSTVGGTPQYMAPEQVTADASRIDERTDIYQLGAVLHECVTGKWRHTGNTVRELLQSAHRSAPVAYDESVPEELAAICNRATAADPAKRYQTVGELRSAVLSFRRHRSATALAREARLRLAALRTMTEGFAEGGTIHEVQIHSLFSECRFGFQQALAAWPESTEAREGLRAATTIMAEYEIARGNLRGAAVLVAEHESPPAELKAKLRALRERVAHHEERHASLQRLERDMDLSIGADTRVALIIQLAVLFALLPLGLGLAVRWGWMPYDHRIPGILAGAFGLFCVVAHAFTRRTMSRTTVGRRFIQAVYTLAGSMLVLILLALSAGIEAPRTIALLLFNNGVALAAMAALLDRRLAWSALSFVAAALLAMVLPRASLEVTAGANLISTLLMALSWRNKREDAPGSRSST